jgi:hypothetical protein
MKITEHKRYSIDDLKEEDLLFLLDILDKVALSEDSSHDASRSLARWKNFCSQFKAPVDEEPKD